MSSGPVKQMLTFSIIFFLVNLNSPACSVAKLFLVLQIFHAV